MFTWLRRWLNRDRRTTQGSTGHVDPPEVGRPRNLDESKLDHSSSHRGGGFSDSGDGGGGD